MAISAGFLTCVFKLRPYYLRPVLAFLAEFTLSALTLSLNHKTRKKLTFWLLINSNSENNNATHKTQCLENRKYKLTGYLGGFYLYFLSFRCCILRWHDSQEKFDRVYCEGILVITFWVLIMISGFILICFANSVWDCELCIWADYLKLFTLTRMTDVKVFILDLLQLNVIYCIKIKLYFFDHVPL